MSKLESLEHHIKDSYERYKPVSTLVDLALIPSSFYRLVNPVAELIEESEPGENYTPEDMQTKHYMALSLRLVALSFEVVRIMYYGMTIYNFLDKQF
jgi:hypothetical protein